MKIGPKYYDDELYIDQTLRQIVEEIIREKLLKFLQDEVPHGVFVKIEKMKKSRTKIGERIYNIEAIIYCLRKSHKGIIIGKNGDMLKKIGSYARMDIEKYLDSKVNLKTWVKVQEDWVNNEKYFKNKE